MFARHPAHLVEHVRHRTPGVRPDEDLDLGWLAVAVESDGGEARARSVLDGPPASLRLVPGPVLGLGLVDDPQDRLAVPAGRAEELVTSHQVRLVSLA